VLIGEFDLADRTQILLDISKTTVGQIDLDKVFVTLDPMMNPAN
jgi:hypothetical protein